MDIRQLRNFHLIARLGSVSKAAVELRVAQPGLSRQVTMLERELGAKLLTRTGRGVTLTEAGAAFAGHVETILAKLDEAQAEVHSRSGPAYGHVNLGLPPSLSVSVAAKVVTDFRARFPNISLRLVEAYSASLYEWLLGGRLDAAVFYNQPPNKRLVTHELYREELFLVGAPDIPHPFEGAVTLHDVARLPLALPSQPHGLRVLIDEAAERDGCSLRVALELDALTVQKMVVAQGVAYGILPYLAVRTEVQQGLLRIFSLQPPLKRTIFTAWLAQKPLSVATRHLMKSLALEVERIAATGEASTNAARPTR